MPLEFDHVLPFSFPNSFLENKIFAFEIHDSIFKVEFPLVSTSGNLQ